MLVGAMHQAVLDAGFLQTRMPSVSVVGLIAVDRPLIAAEQLIRRFSVGNRRIGDMDPANDGVTSIHARVDLIAEHALSAFSAPLRVWVKRWFRGRRILLRCAKCLPGWPRPRWNQ